jgi:hypothetical protein
MRSSANAIQRELEGFGFFCSNRYLTAVIELFTLFSSLQRVNTISIMVRLVLVFTPVMDFASGLGFHDLLRNLFTLRTLRSCVLHGSGSRAIRTRETTATSRSPLPLALVQRRAKPARDFVESLE